MIQRYKMGWPSEQDIRELCGLWKFAIDGSVRRVVPYEKTAEGPRDITLTMYPNREYFESVFLGEPMSAVRLEPMPEQCIPKVVRKERYNVPFPLMRGEG